MADLTDIAQERIERQLEAKIRMLTNRPVRQSATNCGCGEVIPEARRAALPGVQTCVDCQTASELMKRNHR
jgi:phage/conjugal plasmid C-4 type zinc finger TraR family protein